MNRGAQSVIPILVKNVNLAGPYLGSPQEFTRRSQQVAIPRPKPNSSERTQCQSAKRKVQGTIARASQLPASWGLSPGVLTQANQTPTEKMLWEASMWNVACPWSSLKTQCPWIFSCVGLANHPSLIFQTPRRKARVQHKPHILHKRFVLSEALLAVLGMMGTIHWVPIFLPGRYLLD